MRKNNFIAQVSFGNENNPFYRNLFAEGNLLKVTFMQIFFLYLEGDSNGNFKNMSLKFVNGILDDRGWTGQELTIF